MNAVESAAVDDYVDLEAAMPDHICTSCGAWVDEDELDGKIGFRCPACGVWTNSTRTEIDPVEYGEKWPPYRRRVVRL